MSALGFALLFLGSGVFLAALWLPILWLTSRPLSEHDDATLRRAQAAADDEWQRYADAVGWRTER